MQIEPIAMFRSPFTSKFGVPKQSGLAPSVAGRIVFLPRFRNPDALRGLDGFDFVWLLWGFSANPHAATSPVVRPPVLGGNERVGVFATRSPYRPNAIGLSSVRVSRIETGTPEGTVIHVLGADLMDGTPIFDIKPYIAYADSHPDARCGFAPAASPRQPLKVVIPQDVASKFDTEELAALREALSLDPRPAYHHDPEKVYGMPFAGCDIHFRVVEDTVIVESM